MPVMHMSTVSMETSRWPACPTAKLVQLQHSNSFQGSHRACWQSLTSSLSFIFAVPSPASGQRRDAHINRYCHCLKARRGLWCTRIAIYANAGYRHLKKVRVPVWWPTKCITGSHCKVTSTCSTARCLFLSGLDGLGPAGNKVVGAFVRVFLGGIVVVVFLGSLRLYTGYMCLRRHVWGEGHRSVPQISCSWHRVEIDWWTRAVMLILRAPMGFPSQVSAVWNSFHKVCGYHQAYSLGPPFV